MANKTSSVIALIFVMIVWGSIYVVTKVALYDIPLFTFSFLRYFLAAIVLGTVWFFKKDRKLPSKQSWIYIAGMGLFGMTLYFSFFSYSMKMTTATAGAIIHSFTTMMVAIFAAFFLKEKLNKNEKIGLLIATVGVILVTYFTKVEESDAKNALLGNIAMLIAIACWAAYTVVSKKLQKEDALSVTFFSMLIGSLFLLPFAIYELPSFQIQEVSTLSWTMVLYSGIISCALCNFLYHQSLRKLSASQVGAFLTLDPLIGIIFAVIFLHEQIVFVQIAGGLLIFFGLYFCMKKVK